MNPKPVPICATPRLTLRQAEADDAPFLVELMNEPPYLENIGDRGVRTNADAVRYIAERYTASYLRHGFGLYVVELKADGARLGICGLVKRDLLEHPDLGLAFLQRYWSTGYAIEAARETLQFARTTLKMPYLYGVVSPQNTRSIRLLSRLGFRFLRPLELPGYSSASELHGIALDSAEPFAGR